MEGRKKYQVSMKLKWEVVLRFMRRVNKIAKSYLNFITSVRMERLRSHWTDFNDDFFYQLDAQIL